MNPRRQLRLVTLAMQLAMLLGLLATMLMYASVSGCKQRQVAAVEGPSAGQGVARAQGYTDSARQNIASVIPFVSPPGKPLIEAAMQQLASALESMWQASLASDRTEAALAKSQQQNAALRQQIDDERSQHAAAMKAERDHYLGYKARVLLRWIVGIGIALIVAWCALGVWAAFLPAGGIGSTILRLLPFANPFAALRDKWVKPGQVKPMGGQL